MVNKRISISTAIIEVSTLKLGRIGCSRINISGGFVELSKEETARFIPCACQHPDLGSLMADVVLVVGIRPAYKVYHGNFLVIINSIPKEVKMLGKYSCCINPAL